MQSACTRKAHISMSYTNALAYDPARFRSRTTVKFCLLNVAPHSAVLDRFLGWLSIVTGFFLTLFVILGMLLLLPSIAATKVLGVTNYFNTNANGRNVSNLGKGSMTAIKTLSARAQFAKIQSGGGGPDDLAPVFMKHISLFGSGIPGSLLLSRFYLLLARWNYYLTGRIFADQLAASMEKRRGIVFPIGETALLQVRTCWLDDCVETFVREHTQATAGANSSVANLVILGAGYDSRCYRLEHLVDRGISTYEVDAPGTQREKQRVLRDCKVDTGNTVYVSCDFESQDWLECLLSKGFNADQPTFIVWEGVTMYLSVDVVQTTISKTAKLARGSCIGFDYLDASWALSGYLHRMTQRAGEPWKFGMEPSDVDKFISTCNDRRESQDSQELVILEHLRYKELIKRYLPKHYDGRPYGHLGDFGGLVCVSAGK